MTTLPLAGLRILDFTWVIAGPWLTRMLANHGAEVLRLEHSTRPDVLRIYGPYRNGQQTDLPNERGEQEAPSQAGSAVGSGGRKGRTFATGMTTGD